MAYRRDGIEGDYVEGICPVHVACIRIGELAMGTGKSTEDVHSVLFGNQNRR
jgi:hypothetical protein